MYVRRQQAVNGFFPWPMTWKQRYDEPETIPRGLHLGETCQIVFSKLLPNNLRTNPNDDAQLKRQANKSPIHVAVRST